MRRLLHALTVCLAALAAGGALSASAQESAGGYTTRVGGQTFGTETYRITKDAGGSRRAEADASFGGTKLRVVTAIRADASPASFEMEVNGAKAMTQQFTAAGVRVIATGQPEKTVEARPDAEVARKLRAPAFVANGESDTLVMPHHALALARAMGEAGNKRVTLRIFRDLTHHFTPASGGERAGEVSEEFLRALQEWAAGALAKK